MTQKIKLGLLIILLLEFFAFTAPVFAEENKDDFPYHIVPPECRSNPDFVGPQKECDLNSLIQVGYNIAKIIFALTGSAALLMFIYGGAMFVIAAGSQERISKAKEIIKASVIGLLIIFSAWIIVNFVVLALTGGNIGGIGTIFGKNWNELLK